MLVLLGLVVELCFEDDLVKEAGLKVGELNEEGGFLMLWSNSGCVVVGIGAVVAEL